MVEEEEEGAQEGSDGQLRSADSGLRPGPLGRNRTGGWHHFAPVEDVGLRRGQHHHGRGHVRGPVDVVRLPEHRPDPVQSLRLHPAAQQ